MQHPCYMKRYLKRAPALASLLAVLLTSTLPATALCAPADLKTRLNDALASDVRTPADVARDANRLPFETLSFFGLSPNMRVLELMPGGGWYTKLLAPVLADDGALLVAIGTQRVEAMIEEGVLENVAVLPMTGDFMRPEGSRRFQFDGLKLGPDDEGDRVDLALTFRNLHNFTKAGRRSMNEEVFRMLKSGGHYGVVDHTRRHMESDTHENWRRMDPVQMIKEIQAVGFQLVDYSDLHFRADDELRFEVGRKTVTGNTDRFTLLFRKP